MRTLRAPLLTALITSAAVAGLAGWLLLHDPHDPSQPFPFCPLKALTGLQCPGCGGLRASWHLVHGDIAGAFGHNALVVLLIPVMVIGWALWMRQSLTGRPIPRMPKPAAVSIGVAIGIWAVARNFAV